MKIIDAFWEKRNLGVTCQEVTIENNDVDIQACLISLQASYQVVKIPVERPDLIWTVQDLGFKFVEVQFLSTHNLKVPCLTPPLERLKNAITCSKVIGKSVEKINKEILRGIFLTDRVAIDPHFGLERSARRYVGWLDDEIEHGGRVYELTYKSRSVGFFVMKVLGSTCDARIGGVFSDPYIMGLGALLNYLEIVTAKSLGCTILHVPFSSNNPSVLKINNYLNYETKPMFNVFVKHS